MHYIVYDERSFRVVAGSEPESMQKIAQPDVPDNMLALLSALRALRG